MLKTLIGWASKCFSNTELGIFYPELVQPHCGGWRSIYWQSYFLRPDRWIDLGWFVLRALWGANIRCVELEHPMIFVSCSQLLDGSFNMKSIFMCREQSVLLPHHDWCQRTNWLFFLRYGASVAVVDRPKGGVCCDVKNEINEIVTKLLNYLKS